MADTSSAAYHPELPWASVVRRALVSCGQPDLDRSGPRRSLPELRAELDLQPPFVRSARCLLPLALLPLALLEHHADRCGRE